MSSSIKMPYFYNLELKIRSKTLQKIGMFRSISLFPLKHQQGYCYAKTIKMQKTYETT